MLNVCKKRRRNTRYNSWCCINKLNYGKIDFNGFLGILSPAMFHPHPRVEFFEQFGPHCSASGG
jgi:hypothetical protein